KEGVAIARREFASVAGDTIGVNDEQVLLDRQRRHELSMKEPAACAHTKIDVRAMEAQKGVWAKIPGILGEQVRACLDESWLIQAHRNQVAELRWGGSREVLRENDAGALLDSEPAECAKHVASLVATEEVDVPLGNTRQLTCAGPLLSAAQDA